jgi:hypothetical protein
MSSTTFQLFLTSQYFPITAILINICRWSPQKKKVCRQFAQLQLDEASRAACQYAGKPEQSAREAGSLFQRLFSLFFSFAHTQCWSTMLGVLDAEREEGGVRFGALTQGRLRT